MEGHAVERDVHQAEMEESGGNNAVELLAYVRNMEKLPDITVCHETWFEPSNAAAAERQKCPGASSALSTLAGEWVQITTS